MRRLAAGLAAQQGLAQTRAGRALVMALLLLGAGTAAAMVSLWPHGALGLRRTARLPAGALTGETHAH
jgi:hypothetical protein